MISAPCPKCGFNTIKFNGLFYCVACGMQFELTQSTHARTVPNPYTRIEPGAVSPTAKALHDAVEIMKGTS